MYYGYNSFLSKTVKNEPIFIYVTQRKGIYLPLVSPASRIAWKMYASRFFRRTVKGPQTTLLLVFSFRAHNFYDIPLIMFDHKSCLINLYFKYAPPTFFAGLPLFQEKANLRVEQIPFVPKSMVDNSNYRNIHYEGHRQISKQFYICLYRWYKKHSWNILLYSKSGDTTGKHYLIYILSLFIYILH